MLLDVPFIADGDYPDFLAENAGHLASVHFSLSVPQLSDARQRLRVNNPDATLEGLNKLATTPKYVLMNARLHAPDKYFDAQGLADTANSLDILQTEAGIRGVVFADSYFLNALSDHAPAIMTRLEAVPSINCMLDTPAKIFAMLSMIEKTAFRMPSRLVPDRALNRDMTALENVSQEVRKAYPDMQLILMANEGCLYQCPFKPAHDAHISLVNEELCPERTFAINRDFGCVRRLLSDPGSMLASPFIRPEDTHRYEHVADGIKLCGRNRGTTFLKRVVSAYIEGRYDGNILDLMDAMGDLNDRVNIPNQDLPGEFHQRVTACDKLCATCGWCATVMERIAKRTEPGLAGHVSE